MSCKIVKNQDGKIQDVLDQSGNSSSLFKQILNTPTLSLDEAIAVYSNIYSEKLQEKVQFQVTEKNDNRQQNNEILDQLKKTGLAKNVFELSNEEIEAKLVELGVDANIAKQAVVYHGSPYSFDRFTTAAMGTGEGAQAFGWGLYFTDLESIARNYANTLAKVTVKGDTKGYSSSDIRDAISSVELSGSKQKSIENLKKTVEETEKILQENPNKIFEKKRLEATNKLIEVLKNLDIVVDRNLYKVTLHKGKEAGEYNWLEWDTQVSKEAKEKFSSIIKNENLNGEIHNIKLSDKYDVESFDGGKTWKVGDTTKIGEEDEFIATFKDKNEADKEAYKLNFTESSITGKDLYESLAKQIGQKEASLFLLEAGIDGIKYPAESIARGATSDTARGFNYVVFDENAITIEEQIQFQKEGIGLTTAGFTHNGDIFLNESVATDETKVHEFSHLYRDWLRENRPEVHKKGLSLIEAELKLGEKSEIKDIFSYVKSTQPNLTGEAFLEESVVQLLGEKGIELINEVKGKKGGVLEWLYEVWDEIRKMLGLENYSNQEIMNMTLGEYVRATNVSLLKGEEIVGNKAQEYFTRSADRLPLTLQVFSRPEFVKLQGKQVNPVTVITSLNQSGIKQIEKDLIKQVIEANYQGQKKISYDELEATVRANIMPLERITTSSYANYGMDNLGDGNYGEAKTLILNAPVEHGVTGHFSGDFKASGRQNIKYQAKQLNDNTWVAVEEGYESQANDNNIYQYVGTAGTKEAVDAWIDNYEKSGNMTTEEWGELIDLNGKKTEQGALYGKELERFNFLRKKEKTDGVLNKGMFGHIRVWQDGDVFIISELQSDYFQKNNARKDITRNYRDSDKYQKSVSEYYREKDKIEAKYTATTAYSKALIELSKSGVVTEDMSEEDVDIKIKDLEQKYIQENVVNLKKELQELEKKRVKEEENLLKTLSPQEKQFIASQKEWEKRMVREAIKEASLSGATSLRFPTPYTLSVIEGYITIGEEDKAKTKLRSAMEGEIVDYLDTEYIVEYTDIPNGGTEVIISPVQDFIKISYDAFQDMIEEEGEPDTYIESSDGEFVYYTNSLYSNSETIDTKDVSTTKKDFSIENDLSDTQQTVARKYEQIAEILKQERGEDNFEIVTDNNGFDWYSTKIQPSEVNSPVVAFQIIGEKGAANVEQYSQLLSQAKTLEKQGLSKEQIENKTGWFKNKQGQWKYFSNEYIQQFGFKEGYLNIKNKPQLIKNVIKDNIILQAYPELKDLKVLFYDKTFKKLPSQVGEVNGFYNEGEKTLYINVDNRDGKNLESIFSHELVHHLQDLEGFSTGGGKNSILIYAMHLTDASKIKFDDLLNYWNSYDVSRLSEDEKNILEQAKKAYISYKKKDDVALLYQYDRIQGEIDARAVELALKLKDQFADLTYKELTDKIKSSEGINEAQVIDLFYKGFSYDRSKVNEYLSRLNKVKKEDPTNYWSVDVPSLEVVRDAVKNNRLLEVDGGMAIVTADGSLIGLFKDKPEAKNVAKDLQELLVQKSGYKLDNFDGYLTKIYKKNGFRVVSRLAFNEDMASDLKGYNKKLHGTPDVVFMIYDPNNRLDIKERSFTKDQYDEAKAYRDSFAEQSKKIVQDGNRKRWNPSRGNQTLEGAPIIEGATGAIPEIAALAEEYAKEIGINYTRQPKYVEVDESRAKRVAQAYEDMKHDPQDPRVKEAYQNLINQTLAQYNTLVKAGYKFYFFDESNDPYQGNPWNAMRDLRNNKNMGVFATEAGFGSGATELNVEDNPLLADTGLEWGFGSENGQKKRVLANDLFRAVHDAFGHGLEGAGFRARGEENAWQAHVRLFTGSAIGAITSETRGQNSWLNYGKYGEKNRTAKVEDTVFADQKTGLMPEWTWTEGVEKPNFVKGGAAFASFFTKITNTKDGGAKFKGIDQYLNKSIEGFEEELKAYFKYGGNFQKHIVASIPAFLDARIRMLKGMTDAAVVLGRGGNEVNMLDITSSEGYFTKAWAQLAQDKGVNAKADALDAGVTFQRDFNAAPQVPGVEFLLEAWGETFVDPDSGINIPLFVPTKKYEVIHENMGFQFFTATRDKEIKEVKSMLSEGGLFVTAEKLKNKDYARREVLKDQFKAESFTAEEMAEKAKTVLKESDEASVGMMDYQFDRLEYEKVLSNNFKYVVQMYSAGNFAGYYASDDLEVIETALRGTGDTTTKYNEEVTPKIIKDVKSEISLGAQKIAIEPSLSYETPNGETFNTYAEALKNTEEGAIKLKVEDVVLGEVSSSTDINTLLGSINDLVKQGILKGDRILNPDGTISHVTEGKSTVKKLINASISEEQFKGNKVKPSVDSRGDISIVEPQSIYEEVKGMEYSQVKAKYGATTASIVLAAKLFEQNTAAFGQKRLIEDVQQITPENELQEALLNLLNTLGIKTMSLEKYKENYKLRNGVEPSSNALADIANRVIAFTNGEVTQDALTEEVAHFIIEASSQEEIAPLLANIHKTDEWAQYAEEYFNIYQNEDTVRREVLGKVLKNAIQAKFTKTQQTGTANTIIGKLMDLVNKFFTRISEFLTPQHITDLNEYTQKIYDNLMLGELVDELNQEQLDGNHLVLFQTSKNIQSEADLLLAKLNKALEHVEAQDRRLNSVSKEEILTLKDALKIENTDNQEADVARATLGISNIANRQVNYLEKQAKKNLLSSEESAVFALTAGYLFKVLSELDSIISKKDGFPNKKLISDELGRTLENIRKLHGDTYVNQEQNVQRIFEKVGDELGLNDTEKEQLLINFNNIQRDTNVFYAYVGGAINAHNPALNIASALISKAYADRDIAFNTKMRDFMKVTKDAGYTEEQVAGMMSKWKRGHFLFSRFDFQKAEKDMLDEKVKVFKDVFGKEVTAAQLEKEEDTLLKAESTDKKKIYYKKVNDYKQENQVHTPLNEEENRKMNAIYAQVSLETQMKDKELSRRRSAITREAKRNNGFSEKDKFEMEELMRYRATLKSPFNTSGALKPGLVLDAEDNVAIADGFTVDTLEADSKLVYELNLLDKLKAENFKESKQEAATPTTFIEKLKSFVKVVNGQTVADTDKRLEFIKMNASISFSSDFWDTFDRSEGVVAKLKEEGAYTVADQIQKLTTRRKHILKANRMFNNPSEINFEDMSGESILSLIQIEEALEQEYKTANEILGKEDKAINEMSELVTNQAYRNELEDRNLTETDEILDFIKTHTTAANKTKIETARAAVEAYKKGFRKELPKSLRPFITSKDDAYDGLVAYAETKLASYFKKLQPVGFDYDSLLAQIAKDPETFFNNMPKDVSVIPNYIFLGQDENSRVNPKFAKNIDENEPQLQLYTNNAVYDGSGKRVDYKYGSKEFADYFGIKDLENPEATLNKEEYKVLTTLYKFQDDTIEKADMKDKHSRYILPQKRPETLKRISNIKADNKGNLKEGFKELFAYREDDAIYGQTDGKMNLGTTRVGEMTIPRHGFNRMETADEVTDELLYSYLWMAQEAELRKSRVGILGDIESIRTILANKSYGDKHGESTETYKMFDDFVRFNMYGQSESFAFETNFGILSKKVNLAPLVKKFQWWIRLVNLGFSVLTPLTSFLQGSVNFQVEKVVGERIDKDASRLARKQMPKLLSESMSDVMKLTSSSKLNIISEFMGQSNSLERFKNSNYNRLTRGMASSAYLTHATADAPLSAQVMLTVLHDFRIVNGKLTTFAKFAEENKSKTKKEVRAAWKQYEDKVLFNYITIENGVAKITDELKKEVPDIDIRMQNVRNAISIAKQEVDSQITGTDRTKMQRHALLSFLTLHKGWLITSMTRRFKSKHLNLYTGLEEEGSYSGTFGSDSFFSDLVQDWKKNGMNITAIKDTWNKSSVTRRRSMQRVAADIAVTNALVLVALLLKGAADDDDKDFATEFAAYMSYRLAVEVTSQSTAFSNQVYRFMESPTTGLTQIQNILDITDLISPDVIESGTYKDLSRREAWLFKSLPALKEYWKLTNIDRTRKSYQYFNAPVIDYFSIAGTLMKEDKEKE